MTKTATNISLNNASATKTSVISNYGEWANLRLDVQNCINKGGTVLMSYRHKGQTVYKKVSQRNKTHIVVVQRAELAGLILDDPFGKSRIGYDRQLNKTAYNQNSGSSYHLDFKNANPTRTENGSVTNHWNKSQRRTYHKDNIFSGDTPSQSKGEDSIMLKETVYNALYYFRFIWRPGTGPEEAN